MNAHAEATEGIAAEVTIAGFTVKEFRQPPHRRLPWHEHAEASISFVLAGSYVERLRGLDRECSARTIVVKPPHERHSDAFGSRGGHCLLVELSGARLREVAPYTTIASEPSVVRESRALAAGRRIQRELAGVDALSPLAIEGLVLEVLVEATRGQSRQHATMPPAWLRRAQELLHDSFREPVSLASIAGTVGVHPAHLARVFRQYHGVSVGEYIRGLRVDHAARALASTDVAIADIAMDAGFYDQSHFTRRFRQQMGETPSRYRAAFGVG